MVTARHAVQADAEALARFSRSCFGRLHTAAAGEKDLCPRLRRDHPCDAPHGARAAENDNPQAIQPA